MWVTIPLGRRLRLSLGHSSETGWRKLLWRKPSGLGWYPRQDDGWDDGSAGVREPRKPPPTSGASGVKAPS